MANRHFKYLWAACAVLGLSGALWAAPGDGELFPNVKSYDDDVQAPVSKPEQTVDKPKLPRNVTPPSVEAPEAHKEPAKEPATVEKKPDLRWSAYRDHLLTPLLSEESQKRFDKEFAPKVRANLKAKDKSAKEAVDGLWNDAQADGVPADLKRALWLDALGLSIRYRSDLEDRSAKAKAVLPLLTDDTLPVSQARADAVTELAYGAISKASDSLLALVAESQAKLARQQVQGGYPDQAAASLKAAREAFKLMKEPTNGPREAVSEASMWVDRANAARAMADQWKLILAKTPSDPATNAQMALVHLALYGDVAQASPFAAKSDIVELRALATAQGNLLADTTDRPKALRDMLAIAGLLLQIADGSAAQPFDCYAISTLVQTRLAELSATGELTDAQTAQVMALETRAKAIVAKTGIRLPAYSDLAALAAESRTKDASSGQTGASKLQLFVKDNGTLIKYVKPTPKQDAEAVSLIRNKAKTVSEKSGITFAEIETAHCLVFTDWASSEQGFLKKNVEGAYIMSAKMFDFPLSESVFPGKLPLFILTKKDAYVAVSKAMDMTGVEKYIGYFHVDDEGIGQAVMYRESPDSRFTPQECLLEFGRTLSWQMTRAFMDRYRTNKTLPTWLSRGIPSRVSFAQFPTDEQRNAIQKFIAKKRPFKDIVAGSADGYDGQSVAASLVEMLQSKDSKAFVTLINEIKDGEDGEAALKDSYKMSYDDLEKLWPRWIQKH